MKTAQQFTVERTEDARLIRRVMVALGDEILFDEYPEIPDVEPALANPGFLACKVQEGDEVLGIVLCVDFELHTLFLPGLRGARALRAARETLAWLWENTQTPVLRSYFYSHQRQAGLFGRLLGFRAVPSSLPVLHVHGKPVYRTDLILNRPI